MKKLFVFLFTAYSFSKVSAQFNPSFEQVDSNGRFTGWFTIQGKAERASYREVNILPFAATQGSFFVDLIDDTTGSSVLHATIQNRFLFTQRPNSIVMDACYLPSAPNQSGVIELLLKTATNDTVLFSRFFILPQRDTIDTNAIRIVWHTHSFNLDTAYRSTELPDSAIITIQSNTTPQSANAVRNFFVDHLRFSDFLTSLPAHRTQSVTVFPNPATNQINISGRHVAALILYNVSGQPVASTSNQAALEIAGLPDGIYFLHVFDEAGNCTIHKIAKH